MKLKELTYNEKLDILRRFAEAPRPSQEVVAEETHHRKAKIGEVLKEFQSMAWEKARAFCADDQNILRLRPDFIDRKAQEAKDAQRLSTEQLQYIIEQLRTVAENTSDLKKSQRSRELQQMRELGLEYIFFYRKDGSWFVDSSEFRPIAHETGREQDSREDGDLQR